MPTLEEASLIADTRRCVAKVMEIDVQYTTALSVSNRYAELIRLKEAAQINKRRRTPRSLPTALTTNDSVQTLFHWSNLPHAVH